MASYASIERIVRRLTAPTIRRTRLMVSRAIINLIDDAGGVQLVQVDGLEDHTGDDAEHLQPFGLSAHPPKDSEAVALAVGGNQDHLIILGASDRASRPTGLAEGETKVYDKTGSKIHLKSDGDMAMVPSGAYVHVGGDPASAMIAKADLTDARISALEGAHNTFVASFNAAVALYNVHTHTSAATFQPAPPPGGSTVTVAAPTPPQIVATPYGGGSSVAATVGKVT